MRFPTHQPDAPSLKGFSSAIRLVCLLLLAVAMMPVASAFAHRVPVKGDILLFQRELMPAANEQPQYDSRGNQTRDSLFDYEWDAADRLVSVQTRSDVVNMPASQRVEAKKVPDIFSSPGAVYFVYFWSTDSGMGEGIMSPDMYNYGDVRFNDDDIDIVRTRVVSPGS